MTVSSPESQLNPRIMTRIVSRLSDRQMLWIQAMELWQSLQWRIHNSDWQPNWPWRGNGRRQPSSIRHQTSRQGIQHSLNVIWTRFSSLSVVCVRINVRFVISLTKVSRVPEYPGIFSSVSAVGCTGDIIHWWPTNRREPVACDHVTRRAGATETQP